MTKPVYRSRLLMNAADSAVLLVDAQDKLLSLITDHQRLNWNLWRLVRGAQVLQIPRLATEQYPAKLGPTSPALRPFLADERGETPVIHDKMTFSCAGCSGLVSQLELLGRRQVLLAGVETHVCVLQTALDLVAAGFDVFLAADAVGARYPVDHQIALRRLEISGVTLVTVEAALFEWCERAGTTQFKEVSAIVREPLRTDG